MPTSPLTGIERHARDVSAGATHLTALDRSLLELAVAASASVLDHGGIATHTRAALDAGASAGAVTETLVTVSVLGMHALTTGIPIVASELEKAGEPAVTQPLDARRQELHDRLVGDDGYWDAFEEHLPGFVGGLLRLAPETFELFFAYSALPWRSGHLAPRLKEQMYVAIDAAPNHLYVPGLRLHAANARRLGTTDAELAEVLVVAARGDAAALARSLEIVGSAAPDGVPAPAGGA